MNYIDLWQKSFLTWSTIKLPGPLRVRGVRDAHLGPRWERAAVEFVLEPATDLTVVIDIENVDKDPDQKYVEAAIFGLFDVLMVSGPCPVRGVRVRVVDLEIDPIESSQMAFRQAGRDAGRRALQHLGY